MIFATQRPLFFAIIACCMFSVLIAAEDCSICYSPLRVEDRGAEKIVRLHTLSLDGMVADDTQVHKFHEKCIRRSAATETCLNKCPMCRQDINPETSPEYNELPLQQPSNKELQALLKALANGYRRKVEQLMIAYPALRNTYINEKTPLMYAVDAGRLAMVQYLLRTNYGAPIGAQAQDTGMTALMIAVQKGHTRVARELAEYTDVLNLQDNSGRTALMHAVAANKVHIVRWLLAQGADTTLSDAGGFTALTIAEVRCYDDIISLLNPQFGVRRRG